MKITEKQLHLLVYILQDTLTKNVMGYLSVSHEDRSKLVNVILNQQSEDLVDVKDKAEV